MATGMKGLLAWCKIITEPYGDVGVKNMTTSWRDGLAFCAIIHHFRPDLIDFNKLSKENIAENNDLAFRIAEDELGIPALLDVEDMVEMTVPDRLSIMTYVSQYYNYFKDKVPGEIEPQRMVAKKRPAKEPIEAVPPKKEMEHKITSSPKRLKLTKELQDEIQVMRAVARDHYSDTQRPISLGKKNCCSSCGKTVYLMERLSIEGKLFHRICFKCTICGKQLKTSTYEYDKFGDKFYCPEDYKSRKEVGVNGSKKRESSAYDSQEDMDISDSTVEKDSLVNTSPFKRNEQFIRQGIHPNPLKDNEGTGDIIKSKEEKQKVKSKKLSKSIFSGVKSKSKYSPQVDFSNLSYDKHLELSSYMNRRDEKKSDRPLSMPTPTYVNIDSCSSAAGNYEEINNFAKGDISTCDSKKESDLDNLHVDEKMKSQKGSKKKLVLKLKKKKGKKASADKVSNGSDKKQKGKLEEESESGLQHVPKENVYDTVEKYANKSTSEESGKEVDKINIYDNINLCKVIEPSDTKSTSDDNPPGGILTIATNNGDHIYDSLTESLVSVETIDSNESTAKSSGENQSPKSETDTTNDCHNDSSQMIGPKSSNDLVDVEEDVNHICHNEEHIYDTLPETSSSKESASGNEKECENSQLHVNHSLKLDTGMIIDHHIASPEKISPKSIDDTVEDKEDTNHGCEQDNLTNENASQIIQSNYVDMKFTDNDNMSVGMEVHNKNDAVDVENTVDRYSNSSMEIADDGKSSIEINLNENYPSSLHQSDELVSGNDITFSEESRIDVMEDSSFDKNDELQNSKLSSDEIAGEVESISCQKSNELVTHQNTQLDLRTSSGEMESGDLRTSSGEMESGDLRTSSGEMESGEICENIVESKEIIRHIDTEADANLSNDDASMNGDASLHEHTFDRNQVENESTELNIKGEGEHESGNLPQEVIGANAASLSSGISLNECHINERQALSVDQLHSNEFVSSKYEDGLPGTTVNGVQLNDSNDDSLEKNRKEIDLNQLDVEEKFEITDGVADGKSGSAINGNSLENINNSFIPEEVETDDKNEKIAGKSKLDSVDNDLPDASNPFLTPDSSPSATHRKDITNPFLSSGDELSTDGEFGSDEYDESNPFAEDIKLEKISTLDRTRNKSQYKDKLENQESEMRMHSGDIVYDETNPFADDLLDSSNPFADDYLDDSEPTSGNTEEAQVPVIVSNIPKTQKKLVLKTKGGTKVQRGKGSSSDQTLENDNTSLHKFKSKKRPAPKVPPVNDSPNRSLVRLQSSKRLAPKPPAPTADCNSLKQENSPVMQRVQFDKSVDTVIRHSSRKRKAPKPPSASENNYVMEGQIDVPNDNKDEVMNNNLLDDESRESEYLGDSMVKASVDIIEDAAASELVPTDLSCSQVQSSSEVSHHSAVTELPDDEPCNESESKLEDALPHVTSEIDSADERENSDPLGSKEISANVQSIQILEDDKGDLANLSSNEELPPTDKDNKCNDENSSEVSIDTDHHSSKSWESVSESLPAEGGDGFDKEILMNLKAGDTNSLPPMILKSNRNSNVAGWSSSLPDVRASANEKRKAPPKPPQQYVTIDETEMLGNTFTHSKPQRKDDMEKELQFLEVRQRELEMEGVIMEKKLRDCMGGDPEDAYLLTWFELVNQKNQLLRRENELIYMCQELDFLQNQRHAEFELRQLMMKPDGEKTKEDTIREEELLSEILSYVTKRSNIVEQLDKDRLRENEEDQEICSMMAAQGLKYSCEDLANDGSLSEGKKNKVQTSRKHKEKEKHRGKHKHRKEST